MTAIVEDWRRVGINGELKKLVIRTTDAADTSHTFDTNMDASDGRGAEFEKIVDAYHVGLTGTRVDASWNNSTGVVTLGAVSGGAAAVTLVIEGY